MKKVIVSLASLVISLVLCGTAQAQAHRNAWGGGSTYHSGNSTTRTNAYGGSATHTAGQGTTASNAYGGSAYHAQGSGKTTATNAYGGARPTPPDREPPLPTHMVALPIMRKGLEPRLPPTHMAAARHITPDTAPLLRIPLARQLMHIIRPLPIMHIIHLLPRPTTEQRATTAALARLRVPPLPAL